MYSQSKFSLQNKQLSDAEKAGVVPPSPPTIFGNYSPYYANNTPPIFNGYSDYDDDDYDDDSDGGNPTIVMKNKPQQMASVSGPNLFSPSYPVFKSIKQSGNFQPQFGASTGYGNYPAQTQVFNNQASLKPSQYFALKKTQAAINKIKTLQPINQDPVNQISGLKEVVWTEEKTNTFGTKSIKLPNYSTEQKMQMNIFSSKEEEKPNIQEEEKPKTHPLEAQIQKKTQEKSSILSNQMNWKNSDNQPYIFAKKSSQEQSVPKQIESFKKYQSYLVEQAKIVKELSNDSKSSESDWESCSSSNSLSSQEKKKSSLNESKIEVKESPDLIKLEEKPTVEQTVFLPLIEVKNSNESDETIKTEKKTAPKTVNSQEENELEKLRLRVKELESLNQNYLKIIGNLSETVKNLSIGALQKTQSENFPKFESQNKQLDKQTFENILLQNAKNYHDSIMKGFSNEE